MIQVALPYSNNAPYRYAPASMEFVPELYRWLEDNAKGAWRVEESFEPTMAPHGVVYYRTGNTFVFELPCDAILFKLAWCGDFVVPMKESK